MTKTYKKPQRILNCLIDWDSKQITKDASGKMIIKGYANTADKDRVGDVVLPSAFSKTLKEYMENPVVLFQHNWDKVIGKCIKAEVQEDGLYVECEISTASDVEDVRTKIAEGSLKTFSIGYNELLSDYDEASACNVVKELELLEISVVTIPCNPKAKFTTEITEKVEPKEETENKSMFEEGFFDYLADALKQLESNEDIDGTFLEEIHSIYKGGPGSGRRREGGPKDEETRGGEGRRADFAKVGDKGQKLSDKADDLSAKAEEMAKGRMKEERRTAMREAIAHLDKVNGEHATALREHNSKPSGKTESRLKEMNEKLDNAMAGVSNQIDFHKAESKR